jgi:hypothetical protein
LTISISDASSSVLARIDPAWPQLNACSCTASIVVVVVDPSRVVAVLLLGVMGLATYILVERKEWFGGRLTAAVALLAAGAVIHYWATFWLRATFVRRDRSRCHLGGVQPKR